MCEDRGEWVEGRCFETPDRREEAQVHQVINDINTRWETSGELHVRESGAQCHHDL